MDALLLLAALVSNPSAPQDAASVQARRNGEFISRNYPPESLKRGEHGRVEFQLTIEKDGSIAGCDVTKGSGFAILDRETCEMLIRNAHLKPVSGADGRRVRTTRSGYIDWRLPVGVAAAASPTTTVASVDPMICKRTQKPGSLVIRVRRCMTKSEWALQDRLVEDEVRRAQEQRGCSDHGC